MSCCVEKTGLARLAEHPAIILVSYLCALLPLATIYALDFVTERWKSIRHTRRDGMVHLAFSIPPLAFVVFYIHLQRLDGDYKEMAAAITAAILCILHVLRTMWGLSQLHAFKHWNVRALHVLARLGFDFPVYKPLREVPGSSDASNDFFPLDKSELPSSRISTCFSPVIDGLRRLFRLEKMYKFSLRNPHKAHPEVRTAQQLKRAIDHHMMVNSSLLDNEFFGADLPCRPKISILWNAFSKSGKSISPTNPKECAVRWIVSFLARFGSHWLDHTKALGTYKTVEYNGQTGADLPHRLATFIAFCVTHKVKVEPKEIEEASQQVPDRVEAESSQQQVSILSPLHVMCSGLTETWNSALEVTEKNALPYQMRGGGNSKELNFEDYSVNIRNIAQAWHGDSLNELKRKEKDAVLNMTPLQVACFSKLIEEESSQMLPISREMDIPKRKTEKQRFVIFLWQLGHDAGPVEEKDYDVKEISSTLFDAFPVLKESLRPPVTDSAKCPLLQASVQLDNWIALEAGKIFFTHDGAKFEGSVFEAQKHAEFRRLQLETAKLGCAATTARNIRFVGGIMESVRSFLAYWVFCPDSAGFTWSTPVKHQRVDVVCSDQLNDALEEANSEKNVEPDNESKNDRLKCLHMRMVWELQRTMIRFAQPDTGTVEDPNSAYLMILCMLAYPALHVSNSRAISNNNNYLYKIAILGAPQPLHLIFEWNSESKNATVRICCNEGFQKRNFSWKCWKDGFMGRIFAQSEWRSEYLDMKNEKIRKEASVSDITEGSASICQGEERVKYWKGWPPFRSEITGFEMNWNNLGSRVDLDAFLDLAAGRQREKADEVHQIFLQARKLSDNGQMAEALPLFGRCIEAHGHYFALNRCVSDVVNNFNNLPNSEKVANDLLESMYFGMRTICGERATNAGPVYDRAKVIEVCDKVFTETLYSPALAFKGLALFPLLESKNTVDEQCAEAFESYLILDHKIQLLASVSHFCLAIIYSRKYCSTGHPSDKEIALQHFVTVCEFKHSDKTNLYVDIALLLEKGIFSPQEYEEAVGLREVYSRVTSRVWLEESVLDSILQKIFLRTNNSHNRCFKNVKAADDICIGLEQSDSLDSESHRRVGNMRSRMRHEG